MSELISRQKLIEERNAVAERFEALDRALRTGNYYDECCDVDEFITEDDIAVAVEALSQPPADQCVFDYERVIRTLNARYDLAYELYKGTCSEYQAGRMEAYDTAVQMIEEYSNGEPADQWIPCSERLPEEDTYVLICSGEIVHEACFEDGHFSNEYGMWYKAIEYWMPLPEPYKGVE